MESGCDSDSPECWCPCGCGCQDDPNGHDLPFDEKGLCASCSLGQHEVPPWSAARIDDLLAAHESIVAQLKVLRGKLRAQR